MVKTVKEFLWPIRVYYEDTDCGGVVYHTNYLKFMEQARTEMLRSVGFEQDQLREKEKIIFAVHSLTVDYLKPSRFNDLLQVGTSISRSGHASLTFEQLIARQSDQTLLCRAQVRVACLHAVNLVPQPIPDNIRREITYAS
jgi:acyl-CoA thioester hydrolase